MRIDKNATSALSIVQHLYVWERTGHWHDNQSRRRGTRRGQVGRHNTDTTHIFSPTPCLAYCACTISTWHDITDTPHIFSPTPCHAHCACTISTWHDITDTPISFLQRLVLHIAHVLSQLGMIIQTSPISFLQRLVMHIRTLYKCAISALPFQFHVAVTTTLKSFHGLLFQMIQTSSYIWQE